MFDHDDKDNNDGEHGPSFATLTICTLIGLCLWAVLFITVSKLFNLS